MKYLIVIMGVCGSGKSTIATGLSSSTGHPFLEGDDFHPKENIAKMAKGTPLTDKDREAWIDAMGQAIFDRADNTVILSCSALNPFVRNRLLKACKRNIKWVYLKVSREELTRRMQVRENHFMKESMLDSQLSAMQPPEDALTINGDQSSDAIFSDVIAALK